MNSSMTTSPTARAFLHLHSSPFTLRSRKSPSGVCLVSWPPSRSRRTRRLVCMAVSDSSSPNVGFFFQKFQNCSMILSVETFRNLTSLGKWSLLRRHGRSYRFVPTLIPLMVKVCFLISFLRVLNDL